MNDEVLLPDKRDVWLDISWHQLTSFVQKFENNKADLSVSEEISLI